MPHTPPAIIEVTRGGLVESLHAVNVAVCDSAGKTVAAFGDVEKPVFPRSAIKAFQALMLVESGAAEQFGYTDAHIALACSSHNGETIHIDAARQMLERAGASESDLECGAHPPLLDAAREAMYRQNGNACAIHNNCSGKHAGFIAYAKFQGLHTSGYSKPEHPLQREIASILTDLMGTDMGKAPCGTDGCSIPTYAVPLTSIATAAARFGTGVNLDASRTAAATRIRNACTGHPEMVAGTGRMCTNIMQITGDSCFVKTGAEGVYVAMLPGLGLGIALKSVDGATRAAETAIAHFVYSLLPLEGRDKTSMGILANPALKNWNNRAVGEIRVSEKSKSAIASII